jgi:hypothetical protein
MVCSDPPGGQARWTVRLIAQEAVKGKLVPRVGRETIRILLQSHDLAYPGESAKWDLTGLNVGFSGHNISNWILDGVKVGNTSTWTCTAVSTYTGGPPTSPTNPYLHGKWQYSQDLDSVAVVNDVGANVPRVLNFNQIDPVTRCSITPGLLGPWTLGQSPGTTLTEAGCNSSTFTLSGSWPTSISGCSGGAGPTCTLSGTASAAGVFTPTVVLDGEQPIYDHR